MATPNIRKHAHHLAVLGRGTPEEGKKVLRDDPDSLHSAFHEVARLALAGTFNLNPDQRTRVLRQISAIRKLAHLETRKKECTDMLRPQRGGFLSFLAPLLAGIAGPLIGKVLK